MHPQQNSRLTNRLIYGSILVGVLAFGTSARNCRLNFGNPLNYGTMVVASEVSSSAATSPNSFVRVSTVGSVIDVNEQLTIKQLMRYTMTQGLCQKVIKQQASSQDQARLVSLLEQLIELDPPLGSAENWQERVGKLLSAARDVADGRPSHEALSNAANCADCHKEHRPK